MKWLIVVVGLLGAACFDPIEHGPAAVDTVLVGETFTTPASSGMAVGFTSGGNVAISPTSTPASYGVVFRWRGEKVAVNNRALWGAVERGDTLLVWWHQAWRAPKGRPAGSRKVVRDSVRALHPRIEP